MLRAVVPGMVRVSFGTAFRFGAVLALSAALLRAQTGAFVNAANVSPFPASQTDARSANSANAASTASAAVSSERGDALFHGREPISGRIRGHDDGLPPEAVRCANCHEAQATANAGTQRLSRLVAPRLDAALLLEFHQRRGGPPSRYDEAGFCALLRTGTDPAHILIAREMPAYAIDDTQCASLWRYILSASGAATKTK
jgi:hypothetical protein